MKFFTIAFLLFFVTFMKAEKINIGDVPAGPVIRMNRDVWRDTSRPGDVPAGPVIRRKRDVWRDTSRPGDVPAGPVIRRKRDVWRLTSRSVDPEDEDGGQRRPPKAGQWRDASREPPPKPNIPINNLPNCDKEATKLCEGYYLKYPCHKAQKALCEVNNLGGGMDMKILAMKKEIYKRVELMKANEANAKKRIEMWRRIQERKEIKSDEKEDEDLDKRDVEIEIPMDVSEEDNATKKVEGEQKSGSGNDDEDEDGKDGKDGFKDREDDKIKRKKVKRCKKHKDGKTKKGDDKKKPKEKCNKGGRGRNVEFNSRREGPR